ncbi:MAG: hypothetical protein J5710_15625 [Treponema sp.]|nr:hypothetical protein [Treponema sp.]
MPSKISGITSIGYDSSRVQPVRRHTKAEVDAIFDAVEEQEKDRAEIREYLAKFPNPNHLSFSELLAQNKAGAQGDDDEGYVLDIGSK